MSDSLVLRIRRPVGRLRIMSYVEGISLLLLVVVAVPLKYAGRATPELVKILGPIHGVIPSSTASGSSSARSAGGGRSSNRLSILSQA